MAWIFQSDGDYVNFNGGGNLWRLHKGSNCISWHWDESGDLFFDVYDQEYTVKSENIADVVIDGVPLSAASGFPVAITAVFTGVGTQTVLSKTVTLTDAQIKALPTTAIELVASPGIGKVIVIQQAILQANFTSAYTNISSEAYFNIALNGSFSWLSSLLNTIIGATVQQVTGFLGTAGELLLILRETPQILVGTYIINSAGDSMSDIENKSVITDVFNDGGNFTGGNASNTLKVTVYYVVVDL